MRISLAEFLSWDDGTDARYELVGGRAVKQPLVHARRGLMIGNAAGEIDRRLAVRPSCAAAVRCGVRLGEQDFYLADVVATCAPPSSEAHVADPFLVVEILSEADPDRWAVIKVHDYAALASVQEIWLIDGRRRHVEQWWRSAEDRWIVRLPLTGSATFDSPSLAGEPVALDQLYRNTGL
jgi:Uma2 family endonuclease